MIANFKFCYRQLKKDMFTFMFRLVQFAVSIILIIMSMNLVYSYMRFREQIKSASKSGEIYSFNPNSFEVQRDEKKYIDVFKKVLDDLNQSGIEEIVCNNLESSFYKGKHIAVLQVNKNFFYKYNLKGNFSDEVVEKYFNETEMDFETWHEIEKDAIVGFNYSKEYKTGDYLQLLGEKVRIVGFLDKESYYSMPAHDYTSISLDDAIIVNCNVDYAESASMEDRIKSTQFIVKNEKELKVLNDLYVEDIKNNKLDFELLNYSNRLKDSGVLVAEGVLEMGLVGIALLFFSVVGFVFMIVQMIEEKEYEFAVNMLCGARKNDIFKRVIFEPMLILACTYVVVIHFSEFSVFYYIFALSFLLLMVALSVYAHIRINTSTIYEKIRRNQ